MIINTEGKKFTLNGANFYAFITSELSWATFRFSRSINSSLHRLYLPVPFMKSDTLLNIFEQCNNRSLCHLLLKWICMSDGHFNLFPQMLNVIKIWGWDCRATEAFKLSFMSFKLVLKNTNTMEGRTIMLNSAIVK